MRAQKFSVGQTVFATDTGYEGGRQTTVLREIVLTKVGRKWASNDRIRFNVETLEVDNGGIGWTRRVYLSREEYEDVVAHREAWRRLEEVVRRSRAPRHLTAAQLDAIVAALQSEASA